MNEPHHDGPRPRDLALLLLAGGEEPPRQRARDQQADRAGGALRRVVLDRLAALDPEPRDCASALDRIVRELGEPSGPTRAIAATILGDWSDAVVNPGVWSWLLAQAIEASQRDPSARRKGGRWTSTA